MKNQIGVTLLEIVSCMAIISILSGLSVAVTDSLKSSLELRAEIAKLTGELHRARSFAIKNNKRVAFCYTERGYKTFIDDGRGGGISEDWIQQPGELVFADVVLGSRLAISLEESTFSLQRTRFSGSPGIKPGTLVVQGNGGRKSKVIVNAIGRIRVEKP